MRFFSISRGLKEFLKAIFVASFLFSFSSVFSQVSITQAQISGGTKICIGGTFKTLSNIVIDETVSLDAIGGPGITSNDLTIVFEIPAGFEFVSAGTASSNPGGDDISIDAITLLSPTQLQLQFDVDNAATVRDVITISGIQIQATAGSSPQTVTIKRNGGTAIVNGLADGDDVGTVSSILSNLLAVSSSPSPVCAGNTVTITIQNSEPEVTYQIKDVSNAIYSGVYAGNGGALIIPSSPLSSSLTLKVVASYPAGSCSADLADTESVTVSPPLSAPTISPSGPIVRCQGTGSILLTSAIAPGAATYQWYKNGVLLPGEVSQTYAVADAQASSGTFQVQWVDGICPGPLSLGKSIQIYDLPLDKTVNDITPLSVCSGNTITLQVMLSTPGVNYQILDQANNIVSSSLPGNGTNLDIVSNPLSTTVANLKVQAVDAGTSCSRILASPVPVTIYVRPAGANDGYAICSNTNVNDDLTDNITNGVSSSYSWIASSDNLSVTGESLSAKNTATLDDVLINTSSVDQIINYVVTPTSVTGGCAGASYQVNITVHPNPVLSSLLIPPGICSGSTFTYVAAGSTTGSTFSWTSSPVANITGNSASGNGTIVDVLTNTGNAVETVTYVYTVSANGCTNGTPYNVTVTVNPTPVQTITNHALTVCEGIGVDIDYVTPTAGGSISVSAAYPAGITGGTYGSLTVLGSGGTITEVLGNTSSSSQTVVYTFTASGNSCALAVATTSVTVNPTPVFTSTPYVKSICSGTALGFTPTIDVSGSTFSWTSAPVANITGNSASGNGTIVDVLTNTGNAVETVTYVLTVTGPGPTSCVNATTMNYVVTVYPVVKQTIVNSTPSVCEDTALNITYSTPTANGTIVVSAVYPAGVTGSVDYTTPGAGVVNGTIIETLSNSTSTAQTVEYTFTASGNGCTQAITTANVLVNPTPVFTNLPATANICSGGSLNFIPSADVAGTVFTWTALSTGNLTGFTASGSGAITHTLTNTGNNIETLTYTITATAPGSSCVAASPQPYTVTVNPVVKQTIVNTTPSVCEGIPLNITYSTPTFGATLSVQATYPVSVTPGVGYSSSTVLLFPGAITESLTTTSSTAQVVSYTFTTSANGCADAVTTVNVTVNPTPVITNAVLSAAICSGGSLNFIPTSDVAGTVFTWTSSHTGTLTGSTATGSGSITQTITNPGNNVETLTYTITATGPGGSSCVNAVTTDYVVTVYPVVKQMIVNSTPSVCEDTALNITYSTPTANGTIVVSAVYPAGVTGSVDYTTPGAGVVNGTIIETLSNSTSTAQTVEYTFTASGNGCTQAVTTANVIVNPTPVFTSTPYIKSICSGAALGFTPTADVSGSTFSWTSAPVANITGNSASGNGTIVDVLTNTGNAVETVTYVLTVTGPSGCVNVSMTNYTVTVNPAVQHTITNVVPVVCEGVGMNITYTTPTSGATMRVQAAYPVTVTGSVGYSSSTVLTSPGAITESLTTTSVTPQVVTYTFTTSANGCADAVTEVSVTVNPTPVFTNLPATATICSGDQLNFAPAADVAGTIFTWTSSHTGTLTGSTATGSGPITQTITNTGNNIETLTYVITATGPGSSSCVASPTQTYTVMVSPAVKQTVVNTTPSVCEDTALSITYSTPTENGMIVVTAAYPSGVTGSIDYTTPGVTAASGTITETLSNTNNTPQTVVYTFTASGNSCALAVTTTSVTVNPTPVFANLPATATICSGDQLNFAPAADVAGTIFTWTSSHTGTLTGSTATGSGPITQTITNTGNNIETLTYVITATGPGSSSCVAGSTQTYTVMVSPAVKQTVVNTTPSVCEDTALSITYSTPTENGMIVVTAAYPSGVTGSIDYTTPGVTAASGTITETLSNTNNTPQTVVYTFTASGNSCALAVATTSVTVNPTPVFTSTPYVKSICSGTALGFTPTIDVSGSTFSWTSAPVANITGNSASGNGTIVDVLTNTGNAVETVTYVLTVTGPSGCVNVSMTNYTVTVYPSPVETITNHALTVCEGNGVDIDYITPTAGGSVSVSASYPAGITGGTYSALTVLGSGGTITEVLGNTSSSSQTVVYTFTVSGAGCTPVSTTTSVTVNPTPVFTSTPYIKSICSGAALGFTPTADVSGSTFSWTSAPVANITGNSASGNGTIVDVLTNTGNAVETVTYVLTVTGPGPTSCVNATTMNYVVTVYPVVKQTIVNSTPSVCEDTALNITYSTPTANGTIVVSAVYPAGVTGSVDYTTPGAGVVSGTITETLSNSTSTAQTVEYTFTASGNGCTQAITTANVLVNPTPVFTNLPATANICSGGSLNFIPSADVAGTVFTWTALSTGNLTGFTASGSGAITHTLTNTGNNIETLTYTITATAPGSSCVAASPQPYTVTVNPVVKQTIVNTTPSVCEGIPLNITYSTPTFGATLSVQATYPVSVTPGVGYSSSTVLLFPGAITESLTTTSSTAQVVSYTFTTSANGCADAVTTVNVTVNPTPVITNAVLSAAICSGGSLNFIPTSDVAGTVFTWTSSHTGTLTGSTATGSGSITQTITNPGNNVETLTYTITATGPGGSSCVNAVTTDYVVTVYPVVKQTIVNSTPSVCEDTALNITYSTPTANGTIVVSAVYPAGVTGSVDYTIPGAGVVSGTIIETLSNSTSTAQTVEYTFTASGNGCTQAITTANVIVNPTPVVNAVGNQELCNGFTTLAVNFTGNVTSYSWTNSEPGIGLPSSGTGNINPFIALNSGTAPVTATVVVTPHFNSCVGSTTSFTITVNPIPAITNSILTDTRCSNQGALSFVPALNVSGAHYTWDATVLSGIVSGVTPGLVADAPITDNLVNTDGLQAVIRYRITPQGPASTSCGGNFVDYIVTVNPEPVGVNAAQTVCSDMAINYSLLLNVATTPGNKVGSTFSWIAADNADPRVTGESLTSQAGPIITDAITNLSNTDQIVVYTVTPTAMTGCAGNPFQITVTVKPEPVGVTAIASPICSETPFGYNLQTNVNALGNNLASNFSWVATPNADVTGESETVKTGAVIDDILVNLTTVNQIIRYTIIPVGQAGGCTGNSFTIDVTVNPKVVFSAGPDLAICVSDLSISLAGSASFAPAGIVWSGGSNNFSDPTSTTPTYTLSAAERAVTSPLAVTLTLKAMGSGACSDVTDQMVLMVNPLPIVGFFGLPANGSPPSVAENGPQLLLSGSTPGGGGLFTISPGIGLSSTSVSGGFDRATLTPSAATLYTGDPATINHITYTYTNANGCTNSTTQNLIVNAVTDVDFAIQGATLDSSGNYELCSELGSVKLLGFPDVSTGKPPETEFTSLTPGLIIDKVGADYFIRSNGLVSGTYDIKYTYRNFVDAVSFRIRSVKIFASPVAQFSSSNNCIASDVVFTDASTINPTPFPTNIVSWQWSFGDGSLSTIQNPSKRYTDAGNYNISLKVTTLQGCVSASTPTNLRVGEVPDVDFIWSSICNKDKTKFEDETTRVQGTVPSGISTISSYVWDFGDGYTSTGPASGTIPLGENDGRTSGTYKIPDHEYASFGTYTTKLTVLTNDGCNSSLEQKIFILPYSTVTPVAASAYFEDFEATNGGWIGAATTISSDTSWIWGLPSGKVINPAATGTTKAWWTGKNNNTYFPNEKSVVNGPCFDLTQLSRPMVSLDYWVDVEKNLDGAVLQYSTDGGNKWEIVGSVDPLKQDQGINWYTGLGIGKNPGDQPSGGNYGWTDRSGKWLSAKYNLDMITPVELRSQVRLRIAFASNDTDDVNSSWDGFAFDNVFVGNKTRNVLVEHFTNSTDNGSLIANDWLSARYDEQVSITGRASDFHDIQYHIGYPNTDPLNLDNEADPAARANYMGVSQPPATIMDGRINDKFKGSFTEITNIELDRRALEDPQFELTLDTVPTGVQNKISLVLTLKSKKNEVFNAPLIAQVALIENAVGTFKNVLRKQLLGADGEAVNQSWLPNQTRTIAKNDIVINVPVANSSQLTLVAYVQDKNTKEIYQSLVKVAPRKKGSVVTAIEEDPAVPTTLNGIRIYPNPADGSFNFSVSEYSSPGYSWKISDQRGAVLLKGDFENAIDNRKQVDVSNLANGVYFVIISGPGKSSVYQKLVVLNRN